MIFPEPLQPGVLLRRYKRFPAATIDPLYAATLAEVTGQGVLALAARATITPAAITIDRRLPVGL